MYFVYLLRSQKDGSFYIGQTDDIDSRLARHNHGLVQSTKEKCPWEILGYEEYLTRDKARWREYKLKRSYSEKKKFIERFINI